MDPSRLRKKIEGFGEWQLEPKGEDEEGHQSQSFDDLVLKRAAWQSVANAKSQYIQELSPCSSRLKPDTSITNEYKRNQRTYDDVTCPALTCYKKLTLPLAVSQRFQVWLK